MAARWLSSFFEKPLVRRVNRRDPMRTGQSEAGGGLPIFLVAKGLQPFISDELRAVVNQPIVYDAAPGAALAHGIAADALPLVWAI